MPGMVLVGGTWRPIAEASAVLNHPGHADQKSHGRRKGGGKDISATADYDAIAARGMERVGEYAVADRSLTAIQDMQGFNGPPKVVSRAGFDKALANGDVIEVHRGISGDGAERYAEEFRSGSHWPGSGTYGSGTYAATEGAYLDEFQPDARLRIGLQKGAKVASIQDVRREMREYQRSASSDAAREVNNNAGRFAALRGYDAIRIDEANDAPQMIILNRTAVIVQEA